MMSEQAESLMMVTNTFPAWEARKATPADILAAVRTLPGVEEACECGVLKSNHRKSVMPHYKAASLVVPLSEEE
jgi:hypothetical protein